MDLKNLLINTTQMRQAQIHMLCEVNQIKKFTYFMILFTWHLKRHNYGREVISVVMRA